ncbi:MAG: lytic transglycosylase domain-containing protein [Candidatus Binataceae bacterium]
MPVCAYAQDFTSGLQVTGTYQPQKSSTTIPSGETASAKAIPATILSAPVVPDPASKAAMQFIHNGPQRVAPFPVVLNQAVQRYVDAMVAHPGGLILSFERSRPYLPQMVHELEQQGIPPDLVYLAFAESDFSRKGAGPWQLTKATARRFGLVINRFVDERRDPIMATRAAAEYLATLHDETNDWHIALVGWNKGEASLDDFWSLRGANYTLLLEHLPHNTRSLLNRFMAVDVIAHHAREYGLQAVTFTRTTPPPFHQIRVSGGTSLKVVAKRHFTSVPLLRQLNPALLHNQVPPHVESFQIRVPNREEASLGGAGDNF